MYFSLLGAAGFPLLIQRDKPLQQNISTIFTFVHICTNSVVILTIYSVVAIVHVIRWE